MKGGVAMFKYSIKELPEDKVQAPHIEESNESSQVHYYKLTLEPGQTIIAPAKPREFKFYGCEVMKELESIKDKIIEITLEDFDYANGKVRAVTAKTLEVACPHCHHTMLLSSWGWKVCHDKSSQSIITDPAEAMSAQLERNYCLNGLRTCRDVEVIENPLSRDGHVGSDLFMLFQAFIEGGGKSLVIRSYADRTRPIPWPGGPADPFDHPSIHYQNDNTVRFGSMTENLKTLYGCHNCGAVFFAIYNPSESDRESIDGFRLKGLVPERLDAKISKNQDIVSFALSDLDEHTQRLYQWNRETGDFLIDGQTLAFNEDVKLDAKTIIHPVPAQKITKITLRNDATDFDAAEFDQANYFTIKFPDAIPDFLEFAGMDKPGIQISLDNIKIAADSVRPHALLDTIINLSLANRFQGYPINFFRIIWPGRYHREKAFSELARIFYDCKALPVQYEEACLRIKDIRVPERGVTTDGCPMPHFYLMHILKHAEEIFDTN
ncbi:hypothetical protein [Anaerotardibacter muris]|uniref:hypothetical protein n=1 Tax=Anaerotardibacter muris TaxID=2941505 RepID=UPI00203B31B0|nr:hypothetical protein [Anaerotardibacter muris]